MKAPGTWNVFRVGVGGVRVQRARDDRSLPAKGTPLIVRIRDARGPRHGFFNFNFNFNSGPQRFGQFPTAAPGTYLSLLEIPSVGQMGLVYCSSHFYPCGHSIFSLRLPCIRLPPFCSYCHVKRPLMWYQLTPPQPRFSFSVCYPYLNRSRFHPIPGAFLSASTCLSGLFCTRTLDIEDLNLNLFAHGMQLISITG